MATIQKILKDGEVVYPVTKPEAVIDEYGKNVRQELTELSEEVSGLSEKIENLPNGESDVFKAIYGTTTYEAVSEAYNQGKIIHCDYESRCYELAVFTGNIAWFSALNTTTSYLLMLNADSSWSKASYGLENAGNRVDTIKADAKPYQYPSAKAVYEAIQQSGTPSGDPMHYMFEAVGATYNATDADIPMVGVYGDSYVHKAKHWHLNELGDITNEEMRVIYNERYPIPSAKYIPEWFRQSNGRTTLSALEITSSISGNSLAREGSYETLKLDREGKEIIVTVFGEICYKASNCRKVLNVINISGVSGISAPFGGCDKIEEFRLKGLKSNGLGLEYNPRVSKASFLYIIENEAATSPITFKVSNAQYEMLTNDTEIQAALTAHPNVSLAK